MGEGSFIQGVQGVLGGACLQSWFSPRACLSHCTLPAWAPVGAAEEAGAEHLPADRTPGSCPILSLLLAHVLGSQG